MTTVKTTLHNASHYSIEEQIKIVKEDALNISRILDPHESVQLIAVVDNPHIVNFIKGHVYRSVKIKALKETPFMLNFMGADIDLVKESGIDLNHQDERGNTVFHDLLFGYVSPNPTADEIKELSSMKSINEIFLNPDFNIDFSIKNNSGKTVLDLASQISNELYQLIKEHVESIEDKASTERIDNIGEIMGFDR